MYIRIDYTALESSNMSCTYWLDECKTSSFSSNTRGHEVSCGFMCMILLLCIGKQLFNDTVDGRNPAPPGMYKTL